MKVRILGKTYKVKFVSKDRLPNDLGECNDETQTIRVRADISSENQADVLLHEILHGVDYAVNSGLKEEQIHVIATGLLALFYDNKGLTEWVLNQKISRLRKRNTTKC